MFSLWKTHLKQTKFPEYYDLADFTALFLSIVAGTSPKSSKYWETILKPDITRRFELSLTDDESQKFDMVSFLQKENKMSLLLKRICSLSGIQLSESCYKDLESGISFQLLQNGSFLFNPNFLRRINIRTHDESL